MPPWQLTIDTPRESLSKTSAGPVPRLKPRRPLRLACRKTHKPATRRLPPSHSCPFAFIRGSTRSLIRVHSCSFVVQPPPLHSYPFASIRGSTRSPFIRAHSSPFVVQPPTPSFVSIRVQNRHSICGSEHGIRRSRHPSPPSPLPFQGRGVPCGAEV